ncbi:MAG: DUF4328 domain-containing protein, partial [Thermoactinomyces sp.]
TKRSKALRISLYINVALNILLLLGSILEIRSYSEMPENHIPGDTETLSSSWLSVLSDLLLILCYIVNAVLWCLWIYRIYKNLYAMNIPYLRQTPGLAVGWYFIPIACL